MEKIIMTPELIREELLTEAKATDSFATIEASIEAYNKEIAKGEKANASKLAKNQEAIKEALKTINSGMPKSCINKIVVTSDTPVRTAIEMGYYDRLAVGKVQGSDELEVKTKMEIINLRGFKGVKDIAKKMPNFMALTWIDCLYTVIFDEKVDTFGVTLSEELVKAKREAFEKEMGKSVASKTGRKAIVQNIFDGLVFEKAEGKEEVNKFRVFPWAMKYLEDTFMTLDNGKINGVRMPKADTFGKTFMRVAHMVLCNEVIEAR